MLTNEQIKNFAIRLAKSESEDEVIDLLKEYHFWDNPDCWRDFGDVENNYSSIGNQQASSDAALVEKIINSIDATIMGDLLSKGIDPNSPKAPRSITEYLKTHKHIPEGKLSLLDHPTRQKMSEDILLISTQNTTSKNPNYTIIDQGEGQTANSLPHTILSLQASNKMRVGAVQGKFNMGGTGVMIFSGNHKFQVIITRKRQDIPVDLRRDDESFEKWAVTIVRREDPTGNMKSSCFRYLAPFGNILSFEADKLLLKPEYNTYKAEPYQKEMRDGTFIKVFDYNIRGCNGVSTIHLHDRLSLLIPRIALPIKIIECRPTKAKHNKTLYGLCARLDENRQEVLECNPIGINGLLNGEPIQSTLYIFKKEKGESFKKNEAILYTLNGQCQGIESKTFFEKMQLGYIANSILLILDCSQLSQKTIEELFLNSRDRLKKGKVRDDILTFIETEIRNNPKLKILNAKRREEELAKKINNSDMVSNIVGDVLMKSKLLNTLLLQGKDINNPVNTTKPDELPEVDYNGVNFSPYFRLKKKNRTTAELGRKIKIELDTNAVNDYFTRDKEPGSYKLLCSEGVLSNYSLNLMNGTGTLNIEIDSDLFKIGDVAKFNILISDNELIMPIDIEFELLIVDKTPQEFSSNSNKRMTKTKKDKGLPPIQEVRKEDWVKFGMNEFTAIVVKEGEEAGVYDYFCNMDNKYLAKERQNPKSNIRYLEGVFSTALIVSSMGLISYYNRQNKTLLEEDENFDIKNLVEHVSASLAPTIIPIITELSKIEKFKES